MIARVVPRIARDDDESRRLLSLGDQKAEIEGEVEIHKVPAGPGDRHDLDLIADGKIMRQQLDLLLAEEDPGFSELADPVLNMLGIRLPVFRIDEKAIASRADGHAPCLSKVEYRAERDGIGAALPTESSRNSEWQTIGCSQRFTASVNSSAPSRSPLTAPPLRTAGQSLTEEMQDAGYDGIIAPVLLALFMLIVAGLDWWRYALDLKPNPWISSGFALAIAAYAAVRLQLTRTRLRRLKLGRDGERAVAQYLEWFRTAGFFVFHDVPNERANIDHILIGTRGVFTIETKTLSKPLKGECRIRVLGGKIRANDHGLDRDPLVQAKAQARWLSVFLSEARFKAFVQPVVLFPGWFVEPFDMKGEGVWVLEPKALDRFIGNEPERYGSDQVKAMASALSSFIRSKAAL